MEPKTPTPTAAKPRSLVLVPQLVGRTDINRLLRELEALEETSISRQGTAGEPFKVTSLLNQMAVANGYKLLEKSDRRQMVEQLTQIRDQAPLVHISFAAEPSPKVTETLVTWLRSNIHPYMQLQIGLQPSIAAGCVLRTPNKIFDFSLRASFEKQKPYLVELIKGAVAVGNK